MGTEGFSSHLEPKRDFEPPTYRYPHAISCLKDLEPVAIPGYARSPFYDYSRKRVH